MVGSTTPTPKEQLCSLGGWCDGLDFFQCPLGYYGNVTGAVSIELGCKLCPPGYYCDHPATVTFYNNICPEGHYCPLGTKFSNQFPCSPGTFNNDTMQTSLEVGCAGRCPRGKYCPRGSARGMVHVCPSGYYCPGGTPSATFLPCPLGTYRPQSGFYSVDQCMECPAGHYCPSGNNTHPTVAPLPCHPGTYNPLNATGHEFNCLLCPAGKACPTIGLIEPTHTCSQGHYCPNGTIQPNQYPCPAGTLTYEIDLQSAEECTICPAGRACRCLILLNHFPVLKVITVQLEHQLQTSILAHQAHSQN